MFGRGCAGGQRNAAVGGRRVSIIGGTGGQVAGAGGTGGFGGAGQFPVSGGVGGQFASDLASSLGAAGSSGGQFSSFGAVGFGGAQLQGNGAIGFGGGQIQSIGGSGQFSVNGGVSGQTVLLVGREVSPSLVLVVVPHSLISDKLGHLAMVVGGLETATEAGVVASLVGAIRWSTRIPQVLFLTWFAFGAKEGAWNW